MDFWKSPKYSSEVGGVVNSKPENRKAREENETKYAEETGGKYKKFWWCIILLTLNNPIEYNQLINI